MEIEKAVWEMCADRDGDGDGDGGVTEAVKLSNNTNDILDIVLYIAQANNSVKFISSQAVQSVNLVCYIHSGHVDNYDAAAI